jgi:hypothetical protein
VGGSFGPNNGPSGLICSEETLEQFIYYQLVKNDSVPWSCKKNVKNC